VESPTPLAPQLSGKDEKTIFKGKGREIDLPVKKRDYLGRSFWRVCRRRYYILCCQQKWPQNIAAFGIAFSGVFRT